MWQLLWNHSLGLDRGTGILLCSLGVFCLALSCSLERILAEEIDLDHPCIKDRVRILRDGDVTSPSSQYNVVCI